MARSLRLYGGGLSFRVVSGQSSCLAHIWSDSGSFLITCASLSQDGFQQEGFWEAGRTYRLESPPLFGPALILSFRQQHHVPYRNLLL